MPFELHSLLQQARVWPPGTDWFVAFSGGLDSTVLLKVMVEVRAAQGGELTAVHIHHGLSPQADAWAEHCSAIAARLKIPCQIVRVVARAEAGESPEAKARDARYLALSKQLSKNSVLVTAHHQDDQAETVLLQLLRGAGPSGLAAMPRLSVFPPGQLWRPLLEFTRADLYAQAHIWGLSWIEDHSNADTRFDRNYLRQQVTPLLSARWKAWSHTLARSARLCAQTNELAQRYVEALIPDWQEVLLHGLPLSKIRDKDSLTQAALLRFWLILQDLAVPSEVQMRELINQMCHARISASPMLRWPGTVVRRYRERIYAFSTQKSLPCACPPETHWNPVKQPSYPFGDYVVKTSPTLGAGIAVRVASHGLTLGVRQPGAQCLLYNGKHQSLKVLFQTLAIPPWRRENLPLVKLDSWVIAIPGYWISPYVTASTLEQGYVLTLYYGE